MIILIGNYTLVKMKNIAFVIFIIIVAISCSYVKRTTISDPAIQHIVILWLNDPGNKEHRKKLIDVARDLNNIPGVLSISAGEPMPADRAVVDDSFDIAYIFTFENVEAMRNYLIHTDHQKAVANLIKPLVAKMVVYDFPVAVPANGYSENLKNH
jgi:hypothetical protein